MTRMQDERYPKIACYGCVHGVRKWGRPKKQWIDMITEDCKELNMTLQEATNMTRDNTRVWRATWPVRRHRLGHKEKRYRYITRICYRNFL